jgi:predicted nucleic acid-binding protein
MYLIDTNVISEARKGSRAAPGVRRFFDEAEQDQSLLFLSVITIGELNRGVELIRHRGDPRQARRLECWLAHLLDGYVDHILGIDPEIALIWGKLRGLHHENALDKLIAATALIHDLTVVTRNTRHFNIPGLSAINPFSSA